MTRYVRRATKKLLVIKATMQSGGQSIFPPYFPLGNTWELLLEDGTTVYRQPRYSPKTSETHHLKFKRRDSDDALPPPKYVYVMETKYD